MESTGMEGSTVYCADSYSSLSAQGILSHHSHPILYLLINLKSFATPPGDDKCQVQRQGSGEPIKTITEAPSSPLLPWPDNNYTIEVKPNHERVRCFSLSASICLRGCIAELDTHTLTNTYTEPTG